MKSQWATGTGWQIEEGQAIRITTTPFTDIQIENGYLIQDITALHEDETNQTEE